MADRLLVVVRSAEPDELRAVEGWEVRQIVLCRQDPLEVSTAALEEALEGVQALAVTSPRAAMWLDDRSEAILRGFPVLTAGERTASFLPGWNTHVPPQGVGGRAVADLAGAEGIQRLLFLGASRTAGTLEEACRESGIECRHLPIYQTGFVDDVSPDYVQTLRRAQAAAFLAPSAVDALVRLRPDVVLELSAKPAAAAGEKTLEALRRWGWKDVRVAEGPSLDKLAAACEGPAAISGD